MVSSVLPLGYKYLVQEEKFISTTNYEATVRIRGLKTQEQIKTWLQELNETSQITWKVCRTYPKSGRINIFKAEYRCQHKVSGGQSYRGLKRTKNTNCPADLKIIIRRYWRSKAQEKRDPLTKLWPCIVTISNNHNHPIHSADVLQYRSVAPSTQQQLKLHFTNHHSPLTALEMLKLELYVNCPQDYSTKSVDNSFLPQHSYAYREYQKVCGANYQKRDKSNVAECLEALLSQHPSFRGIQSKINEQSNSHVVAILSPIAYRTHKLVEESKNTVYIRTLSVGSGTDRKVKFLLLTTLSKALGQLPLGIIFSESSGLYDSPETICLGMKLWKSLLPPDSFYGAKGPDTILLDSHYARIAPVLTNSELFPGAKVLLNQDVILTESWDWLMDEQAVSPVDRWELYRRIKTLIGANNPVDLQDSYENCLYSPTPSNLSYPNYEEWVEGIYTNGIQKWPNCMRHESYESQSGQHLPNSKNLDVVSTLLLFQLFLRTKNFNVLQFTDFVIRILEIYWKNLILDVIDSSSGGTYVSSQLNIFLPVSGDIALTKVKRIPFSEPGIGLYEVNTTATSGDLSSAQKFIDFDILRCSCRNKSNDSDGHFFLCPHLASVLHKYSVHQSIYTTITPTSHLRNLYYKVATNSKLEEHGPRSSVPNPYPVSFSKENKPKPSPINAQHDNQDFSKLTADEVEDGNKILGKINNWFQNLFDSDQFTVYPALKSMWRTIETLSPGTEQTDALFNFGKELNPLINRVQVVLPQRKSKPVTPRSRARTRGSNSKSKRKSQTLPQESQQSVEEELYQEMIITDHQEEVDDVEGEVEGVSMPVRFVSEQELEDGQEIQESYELMSTEHESFAGQDHQNYVTIILTTNDNDGQGLAQESSEHGNGQVVSFPFDSSLGGPGTSSSLLISSSQLKQFQAEAEEEEEDGTITISDKNHNHEEDNNNQDQDDSGDVPPEMELEIDVV